MSCLYACRKNGITCPRPITCAAHTAMHVRDGGHAIDTDFGQSRLLEQPRPTEPIEQLSEFGTSLMRRFVVLVLAVAAIASAIGYFF